MRAGCALLLMLVAAAPVQAPGPGPGPAGGGVAEAIVGPRIPPRPPGFEALSWTGRANKLLAQGDDLGVIATYDKALASGAAQTMLDWAGAHLSTDDRHALIADLASKTYAEAAAGQADPVRKTEFLRRGAVFKLISIGLTLVDGSACEDPSARLERTNERVASGAAVLGWARAAPPAMRAEMVGRALGIEGATFVKAPADPTVCWAGEEMRRHADTGAAVALGTATLADGRVVTRVYVPVVAGWSPALVPYPAPTRQAAHDNLRAALEALLGMGAGVGAGAGKAP